MEFIGKLKVVVDYRKIKSRGRLKEKSFRIYWKIKSRGRLKEKSYNSPLIILYLFTVYFWTMLVNSKHQLLQKEIPRHSIITCVLENKIQLSRLADFIKKGMMACVSKPVNGSLEHGIIFNKNY